MILSTLSVNNIRHFFQRQISANYSVYRSQRIVTVDKELVEYGIFT